MRRSWLGFQLVLLSCALLLAVVTVEGRHGKEEEDSSEEECPCEKRHHCVEECCRCHHEEEECCCEKRCHYEEVECCCRKKHSHVEEEEADENKHYHAWGKHPQKRRYSLRDVFEVNSGSSEYYEIFAKYTQQKLEEVAAQGVGAVPFYMKEKAITHFNHGREGTYYKPLEHQPEFKKAIGVMVYVKMLLGRTNCTTTKEQGEAGMEYSRAYLEKEGCQLLPESEQQKWNCTFGFFIDMRTEKKTFVNQDCFIIDESEE